MLCCNGARWQLAFAPNPGDHLQLWSLLAKITANPKEWQVAHKNCMAHVMLHPGWCPAVPRGERDPGTWVWPRPPSEVATSPALSDGKPGWFWWEKLSIDILLEISQMKYYWMVLFQTKRVVWVCSRNWTEHTSALSMIRQHRWWHPCDPCGVSPQHLVLKTPGKGGHRSLVELDPSTFGRRHPINMETAPPKSYVDFPAVSSCLSMVRCKKYGVPSQEWCTMVWPPMARSHSLWAWLGSRQFFNQTQWSFSDGSFILSWIQTKLFW